MLGTERITVSNEGLNRVIGHAQGLCVKYYAVNCAKRYAMKKTANRDNAAGNQSRKIHDHTR